MAGWNRILITSVSRDRHGNSGHATIVFGAAAASLAWLLQQNDDNTHQYTSNDAPNDNMPSPASPTLPIRVIRPNPNLEIVFDVRTRTPMYVLESLTKESLTKGKQRARPQFYEEPSIHPPEYRSKLAHYRNSGFDRGHMAPAADFPHDTTQDTFTLCNVAPQNDVVNRTVWNALEEWVRRVVKAQQDTASMVYVVTGPLWLPRKQIDSTQFEYQYVGLGRPPSLVAVPTHFFKVVAVVKEDCIQQFACFVVQNHNPLPSKRLVDYVVPWRDLEAVTGLQFFPQWATSNWKDQAEYLTRQQQDARKINDRATPLLLTDGSTNQISTKTLQKRAKNSATSSVHDLVHLCSNGSCQ